VLQVLQEVAIRGVRAVRLAPLNHRNASTPLRGWLFLYISVKVAHWTRTVPNLVKNPFEPISCHVTVNPDGCFDPVMPTRTHSFSLWWVEVELPREHAEPALPEARLVGVAR
jgi:hypothetical protein